MLVLRKSLVSILGLSVLVMTVFGCSGICPLAAQINYEINLGNAGKTIHREIIGQNTYCTTSITLRNKVLEISYRSSMHGVAGGLFADSYDWKKNTGHHVGPQSTLQFLREARDRQSTPFFIANTRVLGNGSGGSFTTTDTSISSLATIAADWVRYTNHILQTYRQGDTLPERDAQILDSLTWGTSDKLLAPGEAPVPKVTYWKIGNEPEVTYPPVYTLDPADYKNRYKEITRAMLAEDPTIKVGPGVTGQGPDNQWLEQVLADPECRVDFVSYHPYGDLYYIVHYWSGGVLNGELLQAALSWMKDTQIVRKQDIQTSLAEYGRDINTPLAATEWNPSSWQGTSYYGINQSMAQGLGAAETVFSFAELGIIAAHYWVYPAYPSVTVESPIHKVFEELQDKLSDTLVDSYRGNTDRIYTTRDSKTGILTLWALNFSETQDKSFNLSFKNAGFTAAKVTRRILANKNGLPTSLTTRNDPSEVIDWVQTGVTHIDDVQNVTLEVPHATMVVLVVEPEFPYLESNTIDGVAMVSKSVGSRHDDSGWKLDSGGFLGTFIKLQTEGALDFNIKAAGKASDGILPRMNLHVGDTDYAFDVAHTEEPHAQYSDYQVRLTLPPGTHFLRIEFVNADNQEPSGRALFVKNINISGHPVSVDNRLNRENALAASDTYINHYRKQPIRFRVFGPDGNILPSSSLVNVKLKNHEFKFGTAVPGISVEDMTYLNESEANSAFNQFLFSNFNAIVPENAGKWMYNEAVRHYPTMEAVDSMLAYAERNSLAARMHTAVWDHSPQEPYWVNTLQDQAKTSESAKNDYRQAISDRIQYYVADRADRFEDLDGINESYHNPLHTELFGYTGVAGIYSEISAALNGRGKVFENEYSVINYPGDVFGNWYKRHIRQIENLGGVVDGIGVQAHIETAQHDIARDFQVLQNLAGMGKPIKITEFSCNTGSVSPSAAEVLSDTLRIAFGNDKTNGFYMWGFTHNIYRPGAALVDANFNLTEAGQVYVNLMSQWSVDFQSLLNPDGILEFNGFYGDYEVSTPQGSGVVRVEKGHHFIDVYLSSPSAPVAPSSPGVKTRTPSSLEWKWKDNSDNETGFAVYADEDVTLPSTLRVTTAANVTSWEMDGLEANSPASFAVASVNAAGSSARTFRISAYTLAKPPVFAIEGPNAVYSDSGTGSIHTMLPGTVITFTAVNGFGRGPSKASRYVYYLTENPNPPAGYRQAKIWQGGDLSLQPTNGVWYVHLFACNAEGVVNPDCLTLGPYRIGDTCQSIKQLPNNTLVTLPNKVVTAKFASDGYLYIGELDGSSGIRVVSGGAGLNIGDLVNVSGRISTRTLSGFNSERQIIQPVITLVGAQAIPVAVSFNHKTMGGKMLNSLAMGVNDPVGPYNIGSLAKIFGKVTLTSGSYFYIDDGSGVANITGLSTPVKGVMVRAPSSGLAGVGDFVIVTGVQEGSIPYNWSVNRRFIRMRTASDLIKVPQ